MKFIEDAHLDSTARRKEEANEFDAKSLFSTLSSVEERTIIWTRLYEIFRF